MWYHSNHLIQAVLDLAPTTVPILEQLTSASAKILSDSLLRFGRELQQELSWVQPCNSKE